MDEKPFFFPAVAIAGQHQRQRRCGGDTAVPEGILKNGRQVAVKALSAESKQGVREFLTEIDIISNVRHPNLVELIGCCVQGTNRILVYEYVENNSLDRALWGPRSKNIKLDWGRRSAICMGTARGLAFLHEELDPPIVHRDIKASNILLDYDFTPKIGDFGLAKLFPENITHISTRVAGTTLHQQTWQLYEEGKLLELVDPELEEYPEEEALRYIKVALFCIQGAASRRPIMTQVVDMLSRHIRLNEKQLTPPSFFEDSADLSGTLPSSSKQKKSTSDNSTSQLNSSFPVTITQLIPR
ncbi:hypothetical protein HHK36_003713 [Tetracentron sinense]|uniref:non-specific serine/threonine protein kinase n=1 Tax=Tetracentron sinense TaxID=13715 RepID=A0A834ZPI7_TETSI|nr:hypothetical protein HHK36_003713 [Tetracentron sinense]